MVFFLFGGRFWETLGSQAVLLVGEEFRETLGPRAVLLVGEESRATLGSQAALLVGVLLLPLRTGFRVILGSEAAQFVGHCRPGLRRGQPGVSEGWWSAAALALAKEKILSRKARKSLALGYSVSPTLPPLRALSCEFRIDD
jgi:hypothetical protein